MTDTQRSYRPAIEMICENDTKAWLRKDCYPNLSNAKQWAVSELGIEWVDVLVKTTWIRGLTNEEIEAGCEWGGYGCDKHHPHAEEFWEVRAPHD